MPIIVACPSCGGKLRIADALVGQRVRCPTCNHILGRSAEPAPLPPSAPIPQDLPLDLSLDDPSSPPRDKGGLFGAVEVKSPRDDEPAAPAPPPAEPPRPSPPLLNERRHDWEVPDLRRRGPRRDAEPDRGAVVLTLGIISLAGTVIYCAAPVWAILGLAAWIMGQTDLRKMKRGQMDEKGRGMTQAGWICGILGVVFNGLLILGCGAGIGLIWYNERSRPPNTRPIPVTTRKAKMLPPGQPNNPPPRNR
jgi:predicted Zn finger-like uncharacterized protein